MFKLHTDGKILEAIYERYERDYLARQPKLDQAGQSNPAGRNARTNFVPIDIYSLARSLGTEPNALFGRLYYHLEAKYGYTKEHGARVAFFSPRVGQEKNCINFPLLAAVLAGKREEASLAKTALVVSIVAVIVTALSPVLGAIWARSSDAGQSPAVTTPIAPTE